MDVEVRNHALPPSTSTSGITALDVKNQLGESLGRYGLAPYYCWGGPPAPRPRTPCENSPLGCSSFPIVACDAKTGTDLTSIWGRFLGGLNTDVVGRLNVTALPGQRVLAYGSNGSGTWHDWWIFDEQGCQQSRNRCFFNRNFDSVLQPLIADDEGGALLAMVDVGRQVLALAGINPKGVIRFFVEHKIDHEFGNIRQWIGRQRERNTFSFASWGLGSFNIREAWTLEIDANGKIRDEMVFDTPLERTAILPDQKGGYYVSSNEPQTNIPCIGYCRFVAHWHASGVLDWKIRLDGLKQTSSKLTYLLPRSDGNIEIIASDDLAEREQDPVDIIVRATISLQGEIIEPVQQVLIQPLSGAALGSDGAVYVTTLEPPSESDERNGYAWKLAGRESCHNLMTCWEASKIISYHDFSRHCDERESEIRSSMSISLEDPQRLYFAVHSDSESMLQGYHPDPSQTWVRGNQLFCSE